MPARPITSLVLVGWLAVGVVQPRGIVADSPTAAAIPVPGIVVLIDSVELPARIDGVLQSITAGVGDRVRAGQMMGQIAGQTGEADLAVARAESATAAFEADDQVQVTYADKAIAVAEAKLIRYLQANRGASRTYTQTEIDEQQLEIDRLRASRQLALRDQSLARLRHNETLAAADRVAAQIDRGRLASPIDGTILSDPPAVGTWLRTGQTVTRIGDLQRLRVEAYVPADRLSADSVGRPVQIHLRGRPDLINAALTHVGLTVDRVNGDVEVWVDFDNVEPPIPPGTAVELSF